MEIDALVAEAACDPVLAAWISPVYREPSTLFSLHESVLARPCRYTVLDHFFVEAKLGTLIAHQRGLDFTDCDPGANYDSMIATNGLDFASELFANPAWHRYLAFIGGASLAEPGRSTVMWRRHAADARGFWPHSDVNKDQVAFAIGYFNRAWRREDGGLLQFWTRLGSPIARSGDPPPLRWDDHKGKPLDFLAERSELWIEAVAEEKLIPCDLVLTEQILPEYNRLVVATLSDDYVHSVTPSRGRVRDGFLQWLY